MEKTKQELIQEQVSEEAKHASRIGERLQKFTAIPKVVD